MSNVDGPPVLAVCAGVGGIELGLRLIYPHARLVAVVEREACAAGHWLARMEDESVEPAPVFSGDLADFPSGKFRGCVDIITAGLPCQPYSVAGKRQGDDDERAIWPDFIDMVEACRPSVVFLENVPAFISGGHFRGAGEALCRLGYTIEDPIFNRASDVGAPHRRERVFILAHWLVDADEFRCEATRGLQRACPHTSGRQESHGHDRKSSRVLELFPPGPADHGAWGRVLAARPDLAPAVVGDPAEQGRERQGADTHERRARSGNGRRDWQGEAQPAVCRVADGLAGRLDESPPTARADRLRMAGNGAVPLQAAVAYWAILNRIGVDL